MSHMPSIAHCPYLVLRWVKSGPFALALRTVLAVWALGGCTLADEHPTITSPQAQYHAYVSDQQRRDGIAAQEKLLSDSVASKSDYTAAIENLEQCLSHGGISVINHGWNPVNGQCSPVVPQRRRR